MTMARFAPQSRECNVLADFLRRVQEAHRTGDYKAVEAMLAPDVLLRTKEGEQQGVPAAMEFLKGMGRQRYRAQIVAPKGGLITVNVSPILLDGSWGKSHEQVYRLYKDKVVEIMDLGRTPDMVYRPASQPN